MKSRKQMNTSILKNGMLILNFIAISMLFVACTSNFDEGIKLFNDNNWKNSIEFFEKVDSDDENYDKAQEFKTLAKNNILFNQSKELVDKNKLKDAVVTLYKIKSKESDSIFTEYNELLLLAKKKYSEEIFEIITELNDQKNWTSVIKTSEEWAGLMNNNYNEIAVAVDIINQKESAIKNQRYEKAIQDFESAKKAFSENNFSLVKESLNHFPENHPYYKSADSLLRHNEMYYLLSENMTGDFESGITIMNYYGTRGALVFNMTVKSDRSYSIVSIQTSGDLSETKLYHGEIDIVQTIKYVGGSIGLKVNLKSDDDDFEFGINKIDFYKGNNCYEYECHFFFPQLGTMFAQLDFVLHLYKK